MENATITKQGKGWRLTFENGSSLLVNWHSIPEAWDKASITVWREKGLPVKLKNGDSIITKPEPQPIIPKQKQGRKFQGQGNNWQQAQPHEVHNTQNNNNQNMNSTAKSPYNFVPLNEKVIYPEDQDVFFDRYDEKRNTGYIDFNVENKTPLFIRGNKENFLLVKGKPIIPGSSFRGLMRSMVEIVSFSKMRFFNDTRFYYRSFADAALRLRAEYKNNITLKTNVGILYKKGKNYVVIPSKLLGIFSENHFNDYFLDNVTNSWKVYSGKAPGKSTHYLIQHQVSTASEFIMIKHDDRIIKDYKSDVNRNGLDVLDCLKNNNLHQKNGIPVFYQIDSVGSITSFGNTKNYRLPYHSTVKDHLYQEHSTASKNLDLATLIFGIIDDKHKENSNATRVYFEDLFCEAPEFDEECVLKILSSPRPTSFQLYLEQPHKAATPPNELKHWNDTDAMIRGFKNYWHRITLSNNDNPYSYKEKQFSIRRKDFTCFLNNIAKLQNPDKYIDDLLTKGIITSSEDSIQQMKLFFNGELKGYDVQLKEYIKNYFFLDHKQIKQLNIHSVQNTLIKPLKANNKFDGRIRFENLTDIELGALLFVLELPDDCCHKIGMGKPLGLGSIRVSIEKIKLDDRKARYGKLLNDAGNWQLSEKQQTTDFKKVFSDFILSKIESDEKDLWNVSRLKELHAMLHFDSTKQANVAWLKATEYMIFNEFRERGALDTPVNIKTKYLP